MRSLFIAISLLARVWIPSLFASPQLSSSSGLSYGCCVYDPNPAHIWNRLFSTLLIREHNGITYGADELDPVLWSGTKFLLTEPSHQQAILALDEFLKEQAQNQVRDSMKRAMLEHDLCAVFDWSASTRYDYPEQRRELQVRLAEILRRLALSKNEIASLPDNYEAAVESGEFAQQHDPNNPDRAFLPPDLFRADGDWVCIGGTHAPVAKDHIAVFQGRSDFVEFIRLPKGRKATVDYLRALWDYPEPWIVDRNTAVLNPSLPQFPAGTELVLVRRMNLFDHNGSLVGAPITESVQIRVVRDVPTIAGRRFDHTSSEDVYEFDLDRVKLFAGKSGGLRAVNRDE